MINNKYNGLTHTFVSDNLINAIWDDLGKNVAGDTPVTLGTDNWFPLSVPGEVLSRPLYNRLGGFSEEADLTTYFYKNDRIYINDITVFCNFADGLLKNSDHILTPGEVSVNNPLPDYKIENKLTVQIRTFYQQVNGSVEVGTFIFPVNHFNTVNNLGTFAPELPASIISTTVCQWLEVKFFIANTDNQPSYSTKSVNTDFQSDRCLVWCEANLSHTFNTADRDDVIAGSTGWPT